MLFYFSWCRAHAPCLWPPLGPFVGLDIIERIYEKSKSCKERQEIQGALPLVLTSLTVSAALGFSRAQPGGSHIFDFSSHAYNLLVLPRWSVEIDSGQDQKGECMKCIMLGQDQITPHRNCIISGHSSCNISMIHRSSGWKYVWFVNHLVEQVLGFTNPLVEKYSGMTDETSRWRTWVIWLKNMGHVVGDVGSSGWKSLGSAGAEIAA